VRRRRTAILVIAGIATLWMVSVAVLAQNGFTGNLRYVLPPAALLCVLAGVGLMCLPHRPWVIAIVALASIPGVVLAADRLHVSMSSAFADERLFDDLPHAIAKAGGEKRLTSCGRVYSGPFQTQAIAWRLHLREQEVGLLPIDPGTIIARRGSRLARDDRFQDLAITPQWVVKQAC
jgi:hypothetical protein